MHQVIENLTSKLTIIQYKQRGSTDKQGKTVEARNNEEGHKK